ncbi:hypothetical protein D3C84_1011300 [compost metagenome]
MGAGAVVVVEGEVDRLDALHVVGVVGDGVGFADGIGRVRGQFLFQRRKECGEDVDHEAIGSGQDVTDFLVHDGVEDDRAGAVRLRSLVDLLYHGARFLDAVYIGAREFVEGDGFELRQEALAKGFRSDAGAIGDEESGSFHLRQRP